MNNKENKNFLEAIFYLNINKKNDDNNWLFMYVLDNDVISDVVRNEAFLTNDKDLIFNIAKYCNNDLINKIIDKKFMYENQYKLESSIYVNLLDNKNITKQDIDKLYFNNKNLMNDFLLEKIYSNKKTNDEILIEALNNYTYNDTLELYNNPKYENVIKIKTILTKDNINELYDVLNYVKENYDKFSKPLIKYYDNDKLIGESNKHNIDDIIENLENKIKNLENLNNDFER